MIITIPRRGLVTTSGDLFIQPSVLFLLSDLAVASSLTYKGGISHPVPHFLRKRS